MNRLKDRRVILAGGAALALLAGLAIAVFIGRASHPADSPPAARGGLVVQTGRDDDIKLDPKRPLRCFVGGKFIGELPLGDCARRNGVATGALDVGLDPSGALAAANGAADGLTPLPSAPPAATPPPSGADAASAPADSRAADRELETSPPPRSAEPPFSR